MPKDLPSEPLRPYLSMLLAEIEDGESLDAADVLRKLKDTLKLRGQGWRLIKAEGTDAETGDLDTASVYYQDKRKVGWTTEQVLDIVNHLAVVAVLGSWVAIVTTETSRRETIEKAVRRGKLGPLRLARPGRMKAAFVKGKARTLWLKGTHRSTPHLADTKVLGGRDLVPALDPLGDQTYRYTAARCEPDNEDIGEVVGLAVNQSRMWVGRSADWDDFVARVEAVLVQIAATPDIDAEPLPVVASVKADLTGVDGAYDIAVSPPEMLVVGPVIDAAEAETLGDLERVAFNTSFEVTSGSGTSLDAVVHQQGVQLGVFQLDFSDQDGEIETHLITATPVAGQEAAFADVLSHVEDPATLTVYFDSGHTIQDRQAYAVRHRDVPFNGWKWASFANPWQIGQEKPAAGPSAIGQEQSLFDWVLAEWPSGANLAGSPGWLACDDRPGETADFMHIDSSDGVPVLTLIHVKSANSSSLGRGIAVGAYELVCAQAVKNLRHLDSVLASGNLLSGTVPAALDLLAWENGALRTRADFIAELDTLGSNVRRRVVIVQPHVQESLVDQIRVQGDAHHEWLRLCQLDTLLLSTAGMIQSTGAEFAVVGSA